MLDLQHMGLRPDLEIAGQLSIGNFSIECRPLGARLAALEAEADLQTGTAAVARLGIDRHVAGVDFLVTQLLGARFQHLVIVVAGQARNAIGAGRAHLVLGLGVPWLHLGQRHRPVEEVGAINGTISGPGLELVLLEAPRGTRPSGW